MYDGIPLVCKWLTIRNNGQKLVRLNTFVNEILAAVELKPPAPSSRVGSSRTSTWRATTP